MFKILLALALVASAFICFGIVCIGTGTPTGQTSTGQPAGPEPDDLFTIKRTGWRAAEKTIRPTLKAPSTADFPYDEVKGFFMEPLPMADGSTIKQWTLVGAVDAENSFGAKLRSKWTAVVYRKGDSYLVGKIAFEDQSCSYPEYDAIIEESRKAVLAKSLEKWATGEPSPSDAPSARPASSDSPKPKPVVTTDTKKAPEFTKWITLKMKDGSTIIAPYLASDVKFFTIWQDGQEKKIAMESISDLSFSDSKP